MMFLTFLCLIQVKNFTKSQIWLAEMSPIAKSGNSMLMICFDLNKTKLPDLEIKGIATCLIWLFHEIFDYFWPKKVKNIRFLNEFKV